MKKVDVETAELIKCSKCQAVLGWVIRPANGIFEQLGDGGEPYLLEDFMCTSCLKAKRREKFKKMWIEKDVDKLFDDVKKEILSSSEKYRDHFVSSKEALGAITEEYQEVSDDLRLLKMSDGKIHNENYAEISEHLKAELIQLASMSLKAIDSLCDKDHVAADPGADKNEMEETREWLLSLDAPEAIGPCFTEADNRYENYPVDTDVARAAKSWLESFG